MRRTLSKNSHTKKRQKRSWIVGSTVFAVIIIFAIISTFDKPKLTSNHVLPQLPQQPLGDAKTDAKTDVKTDVKTDAKSESYVIPILSNTEPK